MILVEKLLFLRRVPLFSGMVVGELARVAGVAEEVVFPAGSVIFAEGDYGDSLFIIVEGTVEIRRRDRVLAQLHSHGYFGEMSILDGEPRSATALAAEDSLLLKISQEDFHLILSTRFETALAVIRTLSRNLRADPGIDTTRPRAKGADDA